MGEGYKGVTDVIARKVDVFTSLVSCPRSSTAYLSHLSFNLVCPRQLGISIDSKRAFLTLVCKYVCIQISTQQHKTTAKQRKATRESTTQTLEKEHKSREGINFAPDLDLIRARSQSDPHFKRKNNNVSS